MGWFSEVNIEGSGLGNLLTEFLMVPDIQPGDQPSYEICKTIWLYHVLGKKIVEGPIIKAQSQQRIITVQDSPEDFVRDRFVEQWQEDGCNRAIYSLCAITRAYGIGSMAIVIEGVGPDEPLEAKKLPSQKIAFPNFDPLNTAGSLVLNQDPLSIDFMKVVGIAVNGKPFHRSKTVTLQHEQPVYIAYTSSAFGFVGRSVFQRALFPLKSFIQTMVTDDLVVKKAGVFIATLKAAGSIISQTMQGAASLKRLFVKQATNGNTISIGPDEKIETLNMSNIDKAFGMARKDILENIATAADMPALMLKQETYAEGFGEGTEDAKLVADYIDSFREWMQPAYAFMDGICQRRAWNEDFFKTMQEKFPDKYGKMRFEDAFYKWQNSFKAAWPNLLKEPESEKVKSDDVRLKGAIAWVEVLLPNLDPENKALAIEWACDTINQNEMMFENPLVLNIEELMNYEPPQPTAEPGMNKPFAANDSARKERRKAEYADVMGGLLQMMTDRERPKKANGHLNGHAR